MTDDSMHENCETAAPQTILRVEALGVIAAACAVYAYQGYDWQTFAIFFLAPDISLLGYVFGARFGAMLYNIGHSYILPAVVGTVGLLANDQMAMMAAIIWIAHIGFDRALGYGLKYPDAFGHTHLTQ
jgi:hypothetical protein